MRFLVSLFFLISLASCLAITALVAETVTSSRIPASSSQLSKLDDRLASLTFLAAQTDFSDAGELTLFINESEVALIEDMMRERGYLEAAQMAGAFALLRSNDLIWSRLVHDYLMGERSRPIDIMAWNDDATRMPARMHSQYLRSLFLDNDLAAGRFEVGGRLSRCTTFARRSSRSAPSATTWRRGAPCSSFTRSPTR